MEVESNGVPANNPLEGMAMERGLEGSETLQQLRV